MMVVDLLVFTIVGGLVPMGTALQQWINSGEWPPDINWVGMWIGFGIGAATNYLAFRSKTYANWHASRMNNVDKNNDLTKIVT